MARKTVLLDDYDGQQLPDDTKALRVVVGEVARDVYLSDDNLAKFNEAIDPFIADADEVKDTPPVRGSSRKAPARGANAERTRLRQAREWAKNTGFEYPGADGTMRTIGDRGRVPDEVVTAWEEAGEPA